MCSVGYPDIFFNEIRMSLKLEHSFLYIIMWILAHILMFKSLGCKVFERSLFMATFVKSKVQ